MDAKYSPLPSYSRSVYSRRYVGYREYLITIASRIYFSNFYRILYVVLINASLVCIIWTGYNNWEIPTSPIFISLEVGVSILLVLEILLRMLAFKSRFWSKWSNIIDVVVLAMSLLSVAFHFKEDGMIIEEVATDGVVALRNSIQYIRLVIALKNRTKMIGSTVTDIDFNQFSSSEEKEAMLNAENGCQNDEDDFQDLSVEH